MKTRPSEVYYIHDELAAFCFDRAVHLFGSTVENAVNEKVQAAKTRAAAKRAVKTTMDKFLYCDGAPVPGRFRDPARRA